MTNSNRYVSCFKRMPRCLQQCLCAVVAVICLSLLAACGTGNKFKIEGTLVGDPTLNLNVTYYDGARLVSEMLAARDGKFVIDGVATAPTIVDISLHDGSLLAQVLVEPGAKIKATFDVDNRAKVLIASDLESGANTRWAQFLADNQETFGAPVTTAINPAVEAYVAANPADIVSAVLLVTAYDSSQDPYRATELVQGLDPQVRQSPILAPYINYLSRYINADHGDGDGADVLPFAIYVGPDSTFQYNPAEYERSLLAFTHIRDNGRGDSLVPKLRALDKRYRDRQLKIVDISLENDSVTWRRTTRRDSATWLQGWLPGGLSPVGVERLRVQQLPYFVAVDSTGRAMYQGPSLATAIDSLTKKK